MSSTNSRVEALLTAVREVLEHAEESGECRECGAEVCRGSPHKIDPPCRIGTLKALAGAPPLSPEAPGAPVPSMEAIRAALEVEVPAEWRNTVGGLIPTHTEALMAATLRAAYGVDFGRSFSRGAPEEQHVIVSRELLEQLRAAPSEPVTLRVLEVPNYPGRLEFIATRYEPAVSRGAPEPKECICGPSALRAVTRSDCPVHGEP